ncbi:MAG: Gluconolactonase [Acidimicrobiales bacterium]|jgi:gluconolactonase|nr:Gluconolactonase [Acidimicrobiales bacterium]
MKAEVVVDGVRFGEGPVWRAGHHDLIVTSVCDGLLWRVDVERGTKEVFADTDGGANGAALCDDGGLLVTNNGGIDFSKMPPGTVPPGLPTRLATPGLQRAAPDGTVTYLADTGLLAPNDLCVGDDGTVFFTDPGHFPPPAGQLVGRVMAYRPDRTVDVVADGFFYCNGIALDRDGSLVIIEKRGLMRLEPDGGRTWIVQVLGRGAGDGFCLDADGRLYVASTVEHGVRVVDPDGAIVDFLEIDGPGTTTNCCFGGRDNRTLFATDAVPGNVVAWEGLPTPGLPMTTWPTRLL